MKVLILGGTGAMGVALVEILVNSGISVDVTSRRKHQSDNSLLKYIKGDAHNNSFLKVLLKERYDCIVDFMAYNTNEFRQRVDLLLNSTKQYIFLSSSRVYANVNGLITESSPRLLDDSQDEKYLGTDEYALTKARQENFLLGNSKKNWTIVRPYITYNFNRLQLGIFEKEVWLQRALRGKPIVFSKDVAECFTTLTYGYDVAKVMSNLIGKIDTLGQAFHITCDQPIKWMDVLNIYLDELKRILGTEPQVYIVNDYKDLLESCTIKVDTTNS